MCPLLLVAAVSGQGLYQPDLPGTATITVHRPTPSQQDLTATEAAAFGNNLEALRDLLLALPVFRSPKGMSIDGHWWADGTQSGAARGPAQGGGTLWFYPALVKPRAGGSRFRFEATVGVQVHINKPTSGLERYADEHFYEPTRKGEVNGLPIYRGELDCELLPISRTGAVPWVPVTREEFIQASLAGWRKRLESDPQDTMSKQFVEHQQAALAAMSADGRRAQARTQSQEDFYGPQLAPLGSSEGRPLVKAGSAWADPAAPRSAIQLVLMKFDYSADMDPSRPGPAFDGSICPLRVWEVLHQSDWTAVRAAIAGARGRGGAGP